MNKGLKIICIAMITLSIAIIITTTVVYVVSKSHVELLGSWILTETPVENVKTVAVFYFYGYDNFKYDYYINLDHTGNEKSSEARGKYTIDKKNKKIKLHFENRIFLFTMIRVNEHTFTPIIVLIHWYNIKIPTNHNSTV